MSSPSMEQSSRRSVVVSKIRSIGLNPYHQIIDVENHQETIFFSICMKIMSKRLKRFEKKSSTKAHYGVIEI